MSLLFKRYHYIFYVALKHNDYSGLFNKCAFNKINILKRKKCKNRMQNVHYLQSYIRLSLFETTLLELDRAYLRKGSKSNFDRQTICLRGTP